MDGETASASKGFAGLETGTWALAFPVVVAGYSYVVDTDADSNERSFDHATDAATSADSGGHASRAIWSHASAIAWHSDATWQSAIAAFDVDASAASVASENHASQLSPVHASLAVQKIGRIAIVALAIEIDFAEIVVRIAVSGAYGKVAGLTVAVGSERSARDDAMAVDAWTKCCDIVQRCAYPRAQSPSPEQPTDQSEGADLVVRRSTLAHAAKSCDLPLQ